MSLGHYPALLLLRATSLAAVGTSRDPLLLRLLREPAWRDIFHNDVQIRASDALHDNRVLDRDLINTFPRWAGQRWLYPASHLLKEQVEPVLTPLVGDNVSYTALYHRTE